jgi:hypothetical protein
MRIISFDVGMKNLAYCLFTIPNSLNFTSQEATAANLIHHIKIERWDVIDLRFEPPTSETISTPVEVITAPKRTCMNDNKLAKWMFLPPSTEMTHPNVSLYCTKCGEKSKYKTPFREILQYKRKPELLTKKKLDELIDIKANLSTSTLSISTPSPVEMPAKNMKVRKADLIQDIKITLSRDFMEPFDESKYSTYVNTGTVPPLNVKPKKPNYTYAHDLDLITYGRNLAKHLDNILYSTTSDTTNSRVIDMMIIENQISTLASRMKTLQGMITQYFIMKQIPQIEFISASCKLKLFTDTPITHEQNGGDELFIDASTYTDRKKSGIAVCRSLGEISRKHNSDFAKWMSCFENHKKKDDLADCFLQGLWRVHLLSAV